VPSARSEPTRRKVVPQAAGRSLWLAAAWTGAGAAVVGATAAIAIVAVCWLPAAGPAGNAGSAIRAGVLTFLTALHGGSTVDGVPTAFVPLGMTALAGLICWRAGSGLADAADAAAEDRPEILLRAGGLQAAVFAVTCALAAAVAPLGTSRVPVGAALIAGLLLFLLTGGVAFVRSSPLREFVAERLPAPVAGGTRAAAAAVAVYVGAGALLVLASLIVHRGTVETLSGRIGGGWAGAPVLLLGILAAPNAAVAGASYLAGPGFAVGSDTGVSLGSTVHGTLPAFPVLGAVPTGPAGTAAWLLAAVTPVLAGLAVVRVVRAADSWVERWRQAGIAVVAAVLGGGLLAGLAGGSLGGGRLRAVGASPWQFGLATGAGIAVVAGSGLAGLAALAWWRGRDAAAPPVLRATLAAVTSVVGRGEPDDADGGDKLAG
jgi:Family of unknown function (DUF6350)